MRLLYVVVVIAASLLLSCDDSDCSADFNAKCRRVKSGEPPAKVFDTYDIEEIKRLLQKCLDCQD